MDSAAYRQMSYYTSVSYPSLATTGSQNDIYQIAAQGLPIVDTPRHSEGSSSMDADGTESGSDSEHATSFLSQKQQNPAASSTESEAPPAPTRRSSKDPIENEINLPKPPPNFIRRPPVAMQPPLEEDQRLPIRPNAEECLFYIHTGWCGYGSACRYNHPPEKMAHHKPKAFNSLGFPLRENVPDCAFFMRVGICKFGATCKFNHPQKVIDEGVVNNPGQPIIQPLQSAMAQQQQQLQPQPPHQQQAYPLPQHPSTAGAGMVSPRRVRGPPSPNNAVYGQPAGTVSPTNSGFVQTPLSPQGVTGGGYGHNQQPYIVYYVQPTAERCWTFATTGRCPLGTQCPYLH